MVLYFLHSDLTMLSFSQSLTKDEIKSQERIRLLPKYEQQEAALNNQRPIRNILSMVATQKCLFRKTKQFPSSFNCKNSFSRKVSLINKIREYLMTQK